MAKFEKGDRFIPRKPKDTTQFPRWDSAMDKFDGQILTIRKIMLDSIGSEGYVFHPDWCEKVDQVPDVGKMVSSPEIPNNCIMKAGIEMISDEHISTNYYRVEGMGDGCDAKLSTNTDASANITFTQQEFPPKQDVVTYATTLEQALKAEEDFPKYNHIKASILSPQPQTLSTEIDWEQRRYELAKEFMAAQLTWASVDRETTKENIIRSIEIANEMIKQLKGE